MKVPICLLLVAGLVSGCLAANPSTAGASTPSQGVVGDNLTATWFHLQLFFTGADAMNGTRYQNIPVPGGRCGGLQNIDQADVRGYHAWLNLTSAPLPTTANWNFAESTAWGQNAYGNPPLQLDVPRGTPRSHAVPDLYFDVHPAAPLASVEGDAQFSLDFVVYAQHPDKLKVDDPRTNLCYGGPI